MTYARVHMIGIGGAGMSALARLYLQQGVRVTGTDASESPALHDLGALGAEVRAGHHPDLVAGADVVVYSSAVPPADPELVAAARRRIPTMKHAAALGELFNTRRGIAVAGTHGKTTTSSMIAVVLHRCGLQPSFQIGGESVDLRTSAGWGSGEWMVIEADEFDRRFLAYRPEIAVVTNVEPDHFEYYASVEEMEGAFGDFLAKVPARGAIVACGQEPRLARLLAAVSGPSIDRYGNSGGDRMPDGPDGCDWWATDLRERPGGHTFTVHGPAGTAAGSLQIPGRHHVLNALAALATCHRVDAPLGPALAALAAFRGARRRFQLVGEGGGVRVFEDYGHHPTEVRVNVAAARPLVAPGGRLWAVFQPHLLTRTEMLFDEFARAFDGADRVVLTDVYSPSGREPAGTYRGSHELAQAMRHPGAVHVPGMAEARDVLRRELRPSDVVVVFGAGPINQLAADIAADLRAGHVVNAPSDRIAGAGVGR
jgi:UDP-N-acetylmuramate--alanine ligase